MDPKKGLLIGSLFSLIFISCKKDPCKEYQEIVCKNPNSQECIEFKEKKFTEEECKNLLIQQEAEKAIEEAEKELENFSTE